MARLVLSFLIMLICWSVTDTASAAGFSQCNGGTAGNSAASCPIMKMIGDNPAMKQYSLPQPLGNIQLPEKVYFFSGPLCIVDYSVRTTMEGLYAVFSDAFLNPFRVILMLYVCVYAISFMYGLVNPRDFAMRLFKLSLVWMLVSDNCMFYNYLYGGFISASNDLVRIMSEVNAVGPPPANAAAAQKQLYQSLDDMFANVVGMDGIVSLGIFLLSSITSGSQGLMTGMLGVLGFGSMALALLRALVTLGIAMAGIAFFLLFTPMFLSFFLFQNTKRLFDNWLSLLISFTLQPFIIFAFLVMMRTVIDNAGSVDKAQPNVNINQVMQDAMKMIGNKALQPEMMQGRPTINIYQPDREAMVAFGKQFGITIDAADDDLAVQRKFYQYFIPKLMFWFLINMVMAGFIKEVPGLAQRLSGYISAPTLGATQDNAFSQATGAVGIDLPGISRGAGGDVTSMLGASLGKNKVLRGAATAGIGLMTADALNKGVLRGEPDLENRAAVGEAARDRAGAATRAGTLGELLGNKKAERDAALGLGIGSEKTAPREGPNVVGIGEAEGAVRRDTILTAQQKADEKALAIANQNMKTGAEFLGVKQEQLPDQPTVRRDINMRDIEIVSRNKGTTTYMVNGRKVEIPKNQEMAFLNQQIAAINKDIAKTKTMGRRGAQEMQISEQQRDALEVRRKELVTEMGGRVAPPSPREKLAASQKHALGTVQNMVERQRIQGALDPQLAQISKDLPVIMQRQDSVALAQMINQLKAGPQTAESAKLIRDLEEMEDAMRVETAARTTSTPPPLPQPAERRVVTNEPLRQALIEEQERLLKELQEGGLDKKLGELASRETVKPEAAAPELTPEQKLVAEKAQATNQWMSEQLSEASGGILATPEPEKDSKVIQNLVADAAGATAAPAGAKVITQKVKVLNPEWNPDPSHPDHNKPQWLEEEKQIIA